jgi:hypothetical protein
MPVNNQIPIQTIVQHQPEYITPSQNVLKTQ